MSGFALPDGRRLSYLESGDGPPLVCHPGGPGGPVSSLGELGGLGAERTLIALEPRGTGASDRPADAGDYETGGYVEDLEALRAHLGVERLILLGHAHGALVALAHAASHPDRVERLILVAASARWSAEHVAAMESALAERSGEPWFADAIVAFTAEDESEPPLDGADLGAQVARALPLYFGAFGEAEAAYVESARDDEWNGVALRRFERAERDALDMRGGLARVTAPTLVISGERDFMFGPHSGREVAGGIAGARLEVLPGVGQFPWIEAPDDFRTTVADFLASAPAPAAG